MGVLRFLLAISVVLAHSTDIFGFSLVNSVVAVQAFYIISGFYMTLILNEKYIGKSNSYRLFITNRFLRLYPIYWVVLLLTTLGSLTVYIITKGEDAVVLESYVNYFSNLDLLTFSFLVFTNIAVLFQDLVMFFNLNLETFSVALSSNNTNNIPLYKFLIIPQAWTVGVELLFYLVAPFIVRRKLKVVFALIVLSLLIRFVLVSKGFDYDPWSYRFFPNELVFFLLGVLGYHIHKKKFFIENKKWLKKLELFIFIGLVFLTLAYNKIDLQYLNLFYLVVFFVAVPFIFNLTKKSKLDRLIGDLSYPIYISHLFILMIINALNINIFWGKGLTLVILTSIFSFILNKVISDRIEVFRQKRVAGNK